uniref:Phosphotransferase n=1 Tax=Arcella intermedia TaxID=1963864 RepID=A0A6B2L413_9EUKA
MTKIKSAFQEELKQGLIEGDDKSTLAMIPTFVTKLPKGTETGLTYALDIGGTNLRVFKVLLTGHSTAQITASVSIEIPKDIQFLDVHAFFSFVADQVKLLVGDTQEEIQLGFTFSFAYQQTSINSGILLRWTKGFNASGFGDKDVVVLLQEALRKKGINANVGALIDDTTGTMLTGSYKNIGPNCCMGVIIGTGINICYWEDLHNIKKLPGEHPKGDGMIVNTEAGNFGSLPSLGRDLVITKWDQILNAQSLNPDQQMLEKQVSGMYLGELFRIMLLDLVRNGDLVKEDEKNGKLEQKDGFSTQEMGIVEADETPQLSKVEQQLVNYSIQSTLEQRKLVQRLAFGISSRASALVASIVAGCLSQMGRDKEEVSVAVDGSVFEKYPNFKQRIQTNLQMLLGHNKVHLVLVKDGSGVGAALATLIFGKENKVDI